MNTNKFETLSLNEQEEINGGGAVIVIGAIIVGVIIDEAVERITGKDVFEHVGNGLKAIGDFFIGK